MSFVGVDFKPSPIELHNPQQTPCVSLVMSCLIHFSQRVAWIEDIRG
jgi:hypothetical protein